MKTRVATAVLLCACAGGGTRSTAGAAWPSGSRLVDLTHTFDATTIYWPTAPTGFALVSDGRP